MSIDKVDRTQMFAVEGRKGCYFDVDIDSRYSGGLDRKTTIQNFRRNLGESALVARQFSPMVAPRVIGAAENGQILNALLSERYDQPIPFDMWAPVASLAEAAWTLGSHRAHELESQSGDAVRIDELRTFSKRLGDKLNYLKLPALQWVDYEGVICNPDQSDSDQRNKLIPVVHPLDATVDASLIGHAVQAGNANGSIEVHPVKHRRRGASTVNPTHYREHLVYKDATGNIFPAS